MLGKCITWWKTLFFHLIDIAIVNSYILFQLHCWNNPDEEALRRPAKYSILEFREEVISHILGLDQYGNPPCYKQTQEPNQFQTVHMPVWTDSRKNYKVCYVMKKRRYKCFHTAVLPSVMFSCIVLLIRIVLKFGIQKNLMNTGNKTEKLESNNKM